MHVRKCTIVYARDRERRRAALDSAAVHSRAREAASVEESKRRAKYGRAK